MTTQEIAKGSRYSPLQEVQAMPLEHLISGPMTAFVDSQIAAGMATKEFLETVGFKKSSAPTKDMPTSLVNDEPVTVTFDYERRTDLNTIRKEKFTVPLITMIPIPVLRIQEASLEFNIKISSAYSEKNAVEAARTDTFQETGASTDITQEEDGNEVVHSGWATASSFTASVSNTSSSNEGYDVNREYSMHVKVVAVQDEQPTGMQKILAILESQIFESIGTQGVEALVS